jgi:hypothetical protein
MVLITRRRKVGTICGHEIYSIGKSKMIALPSVIVWPNVAYSRDENRSFVFSTCKYYVLPTVTPSIVPSDIKTTGFSFLRTSCGFIVRLNSNPFFVCIFEFFLLLSGVMMQLFCR